MGGPNDGSGAYAICALPDLCRGIVSGRLGHLDPWISSVDGQLLENLGCARGFLSLFVSRRVGAADTEWDASGLKPSPGVILHS